jgi:hypothetical protein
MEKKLDEKGAENLGPAQSQAQEKPNVVFILVDNVGW